MRTLTVREASQQLAELTAGEAAAIQALGSQLAGSSSWWGHSAEDVPPAKSVVSCSPHNETRWHLRIGDVVGLIVVGQLQIVVEPKIPAEHLLYLLGRGDYLPRVAPSEAGQLLRDESLWELLAGWYMSALERVLRADLLRDYTAVRASIPITRGRIDPLDSGRDYYRGKLQLTCEFEEFNEDSGLNRVLKEAARRLVQAPVLREPLRRRAARALARMDGVGLMQPQDLRSAGIDRRSAYYRTALLLAGNVLLSQGRTLRAGLQPAWTFLIRTPEPVEAGVREVLRAGLPDGQVRKAGIMLAGSSMTLNPDLVFGSPDAIGDVKYKQASSDWDRPDLYQLVALATGYQVEHACLFSFAGPRSKRPSARYCWQRPPRLGGVERRPGDRPCRCRCRLRCPFPLLVRPSSRDRHLRRWLDDVLQPVAAEPRSRATDRRARSSSQKLL